MGDASPAPGPPEGPRKGKRKGQRCQEQGAVSQNRSDKDPDVVFSSSDARCFSRLTCCTSGKTAAGITGEKVQKKQVGVWEFRSIPLILLTNVLSTFPRPPPPPWRDGHGCPSLSW